MARNPLILAALAVVSLLAATDARAALRLSEIGRFQQPVHLAAAPGQDGRLYVLERSGRVWVLGRGGRRRVFLDARRYVRLRTPRQHMSDQGGAFSIAFGPGRRLYMLYTRRDGRVHLDELRRGRRPRTLLSVPRRSRLDVGGHIAFGPDGLLYASLGFGREPESSQDPDRLTGKLLRLDAAAAGAAPEVFASGLRVPWRFSFDRPTRRLIVGDVGEAGFEEVNVLSLSGDAGANLGWPFFEGHGRRLAGGPSGTKRPVLALPHPLVCAIVGGYVVRTPTLRRLRGRYLYGDLCSGRIRSVRLAGGRALGDRFEGTTVPYLVSFGHDGAGRLYALSLFGKVFRLG